MKSKDLNSLKGFLSGASNRIRTLEYYFGRKGTSALMEIALHEQEQMSDRSFTSDDELLAMLGALDFVVIDDARTTGVIIGEVKYTWDGEKWENHSSASLDPKRVLLDHDHPSGSQGQDPVHLHASQAFHRLSFREAHPRLW